MAKADSTSMLEVEIEATRDRLAKSIDQLIAQASPRAIASRQMEAAKGFFVDPASGRVNVKHVAVVGGSVLGMVMLRMVIRRLGSR